MGLPFFMNHFTSSKYVHNHAVALKWEKETWLLFVFSFVNRNICVLSSNDKVRHNEPHRAFWAWVLKATGWQIHVGEQGRKEASSCICVTTTPASHSQDFFSDRDNKTSSRWLWKKNCVLVQVTAVFFYPQDLLSDYNQPVSKCQFTLIKYEIHNHVCCLNLFWVMSLEWLFKSSFQGS